MATPTPSRIKAALQRLSPKQRQYATLGAIMACGVGLLWAVFAFNDNRMKLANPQQATGASSASSVTNIGVMPPGQQVNAVDQWVGTAGRKLAQYEQEREDQSRVNRDRKEFEDRTLQRFGELEQRLTGARQMPSTPASPQPTPAPNSPAPAPAAPVTIYPPASALPRGPVSGQAGALPAVVAADPEAATPSMVHVSMADPAKASQSPATSTTTVTGRDSTRDTIDTYLPVSFTRGILLGGLDAPTGGQSQSNPHPVLIRLSDNAVLPNRFRAEYRECFVIAAGYGDISSERAYLRTENLSCVRRDGATLEVKIQGSVYGEDGKVGLRGRLVTKQGQMLANALMAGVVSGIGQGLSTSSTNYSTSALGTVATASGSDAYRAGLGAGVGRALDRLAQYYIKLAENTFPVIEIDAGREIDVVITKGVRIPAPTVAQTTTSKPSATATRFAPEERYLMKEHTDEDD